MKKIGLLLSIIFFSLFNIGFGQSSLIHLSFTGVFNSQHIDTDSINIRNLTQNCDTVLYWPDTSLTFLITGIHPVEGDQKEEIDFIQVSDVGEGEGNILRLIISKAGQTQIEKIDLLGRRQDIYCHYLPAGVHDFKLLFGKEKICIVSVKHNGLIRSIKLLYNHEEGPSVGRLIYLGFRDPEKTYKSTQLTSGFNFWPGDSLKITGYYDTLLSEIYPAPANSADFTLHFGMNLFCPGLPSFSYGGQTYTTVQIGTQCWMRENLNIGSMLNGFSEQTDNGVIEKYCYDNDPAKCSVYGGLYQWDEMMQYSTTPGIQGICHTGWHLPTDAEYCTLTVYLDPTVDCNFWGFSGSNAAGRMKETGFTHWSAPNSGATNQSGFTARGSGDRYGWGGGFYYLNEDADFWTSTEYSSTYAVFRYLSNYGADINRDKYVKSFGYSVRCLKDN
ncbi:MAG: fibrobacter succinogenes major paralogous domain-containing protein [Bacteroidetes bacterium]|nr:fibrobacter succinogenes major paralogous domain-containing protein [Bacteroidota bacterium]